jgi:hypothetical protein
VLDADAGVVLRASGPAAQALTAIAATANPGAPGTAPEADLLPTHLDGTVAALAERGVIVANADPNTGTDTDTDAHPTDINGATTGMSRRRHQDPHGPSKAPPPTTTGKASLTATADCSRNVDHLVGEG